MGVKKTFARISKAKAIILFAGILTGNETICPAFEQSSQEQSVPEIPSSARRTTGASRTPQSQSSPALGKRAIGFYRGLWGIDDILVRTTSSGELIRFSYRVTDATKAQLFADKRATPYLIDEKSGRALQVPVLEKVGQLRQMSTPENGRTYWMVFSNRGGYVQPGSRVDIVIGSLRINGLVVE